MNNISRRSALAAISSITTVASVPALATNTGGTLHALVLSHKAAIEVSEAAWTLVGDIDEATNIPPARVQIGKRLIGRNDDGTDDFDPIYAYSLIAIDKDCQKQLDWKLSWYDRTPEATAIIRELSEQRRARLTNALLEAQAAEREAERACGLTDAREKAHAASMVVDERLEAILAYPYQTVGEVREACAHLVRCRKAALDGVDGDMLEQFVQRLGGVAS